MCAAGSLDWVSAQSRAGRPRRRLSKQALVRRLSGVHNFQITPFLADYGLDGAGLRDNISALVQVVSDPTVFVVSGGLGELFTLSVDEHAELVKMAVKGAGGRFPVVAGVGGGYANVRLMARNAEVAGADAIIVFASPFACDDAEGAYEYVREAARSVSIGVLVYNCGQKDFWPDVLRRLAALPNVVGIKDGSGDVEVGKALGDVVGDSFLWAAEGEEHAQNTMPLGARAYTTAVAAFVPDACNEFWAAGVDGDVENMKELRETRIDPVAKLRSVQTGYGISGIKVALESLGRAGGPVRPPGKQVTPQDRAKITAIALEHTEENVQAAKSDWRPKGATPRPTGRRVRKKG